VKGSRAAASERVDDRIRRLLIVALAAVVAVVALGNTMSQAASPGGPTRGDAEGIFQAFFSGGTAIRAHTHLAEGVPGVPAETTPDGARIHPLLDDLGYCDESWHVVLLGAFDDPAFYVGGNRELFDYLAAI
jgi:hypothetical protein